jgi:hypothetical protein
MNLRQLAWRAVAAGVIATPGCYAYADPDVGYADVTSAPVEIEESPSVYYEGRPVFLYGDRWWYRDGRGWRYYRREPAELHRQRPFARRVPRGPRNERR